MAFNKILLLCPVILVISLLSTAPSLAQNKTAKKKKKGAPVLERRTEIRDVAEEYVPSASQKGHHKTSKTKKVIRQNHPENKHVLKSKKKRHKEEQKRDLPPYEDGEEYHPPMPKKHKKKLKEHRKKFKAAKSKTQPETK